MADISRLNQPSYSLGYVTGPITCWNNLVVQHNWGKDQEGFAWLCHVYLLPPTYWVWTYACYNTCLSLSLCVTNRRWRLRVHKHQYRRCCNVYRWGQRQRVKPKQHLPPHCQVMLIEFQQLVTSPRNSAVFVSRDVIKRSNEVWRAFPWKNSMASLANWWQLVELDSNFTFKCRAAHFGTKTIAKIHENRQ